MAGVVVNMKREKSEVVGVMIEVMVLEIEKSVTAPVVEPREVDAKMVQGIEEPSRNGLEGEQANVDD